MTVEREVVLVAYHIYAVNEYGEEYHHGYFSSEEKASKEMGIFRDQMTSQFEMDEYSTFEFQNEEVVVY